MACCVASLLLVRDWLAECATAVIQKIPVVLDMAESTLSDSCWNQPPILSIGERRAGVRDTRPTEFDKGVLDYRKTFDALKLTNYSIQSITRFRMLDSRCFTARCRGRRRIRIGSRKTGGVARAEIKFRSAGSATAFYRSDGAGRTLTLPITLRYFYWWYRHRQFQRRKR